MMYVSRDSRENSTPELMESLYKNDKKNKLKNAGGNNGCGMYYTALLRLAWPACQVHGWLVICQF